MCLPVFAFSFSSFFKTHIFFLGLGFGVLFGLTVTFSKFFLMSCDLLAQGKQLGSCENG